MEIPTFPFLGMLVFTSLPSVAAELELATPFGDHMVLQRDEPVPVWGWAEAGESITVRFAGQEKDATAGEDGAWRVDLDPLAASAEPRALVVSSGEGDRRVALNDVLVGEVWLGSGQSNMAMPVRRAKGADAEIAAADFPGIRLFEERSRFADEPRPRGEGEWAVCSPDTVGEFSAALYYFGRAVHRELDVPVGLMVSAVGGTDIGTWIPEEAQRDDEALRPYLDLLDSTYARLTSRQAMERHRRELAEWKKEAAAAREKDRRPPRRPRDPVDFAKRKAGLGVLYDGKIAPLVPFAVCGAVWYQGEANTVPDKAPYYRHQLPLLVRTWRERWDDDFPFAWVQLPNFSSADRQFPLVREAMLRSLSLPDTGMAVTLDIGEADDIHPKNKQDVGRRLALWALGTVYDRDVPAVSGPLPAGNEIRDGAIEVRFEHAEGGLVAKGGELGGFLVAGEDRRWKPAKAVIEDDSVVVSSPEVPEPVAVRYAWENDPEATLFNAAGLPASPFRTDDWDPEAPENG